MDYRNENKNDVENKRKRETKSTRCVVRIKNIVYVTSVTNGMDLVMDVPHRLRIFFIRNLTRNILYLRYKHTLIVSISLRLSELIEKNYKCL